MTTQTGTIEERWAELGREFGWEFRDPKEVSVEQALAKAAMLAVLEEAERWDPEDNYLGDQAATRTRIEALA